MVVKPLAVQAVVLLDPGELFRSYVAGKIYLHTEDLSGTTDFDKSGVEFLG